MSDGRTECNGDSSFRSLIYVSRKSGRGVAYTQDKTPINKGVRKHSLGAPLYDLDEHSFEEYYGSSGRGFFYDKIEEKAQKHQRQKENGLTSLLTPHRRVYNRSTCHTQKPSVWISPTRHHD